MIFPIGDDNVKGGYKPYFSYLFLALNIIAFILTAGNLQQSADVFGANPCEIKQGQDLFALFTSMFMHGGLLHIIGNMLFLWIFADNIESTIGNIRFAIFYILGGLVAAYAHIIIGAGTECTPMVGASGAIAAVLGAYVVMYPKSRIKLTILFLKSFRIPAFIFLGLWIVQELLSGFGALSFVKDVGGGVAYWAHIGGFMFGVLAGLYFKTRFPQIALVRKDKNPEYHSVKVEPRRYNNRFGQN